MNAVTIARFNSEGKALTLRFQMEACGIHAEVRDEAREGGGQVGIPLLGNIVFEVDEKDVEGATHLLKDWDDSEGSLSDALHCPHCNSLRINKLQGARNDILAKVTALLGGLIDQKEFYCEKCHWAWSREEMATPMSKAA